MAGQLRHLQRGRVLKNWGIKQRVLFVALMPALMIALSLAVYFLVLRYADVDNALHSRGAALARQLGQAAEYGVFASNLTELRRLAKIEVQEPDVSAVVFYDRSGTRLAAAGDNRFPDTPNEYSDGLTGGSEDGETIFFHVKIRSAAERFEDLFNASRDAARPPSELLGSVTLEMSRAAVVARKREILVVTVLFTLAALAAGALLARRLSRDVTEPILSLQEAVTKIQIGNLDARVTPHPANTLRALETGINAMAAALLIGRDHLRLRIAEATAELRAKNNEAERISLAKSRFLAAASHDLRQPLHALSLFAAEFEQQAINLTQRRLLQQISTAIDAMNDQLNHLLDISRLDLDGARPRREAVALEPLIERVIAMNQPGAHAKGLRLWQIPTAAWTASDPYLLERMLGNLISNAVRYTSEGSITVGVRRNGSDWRLEVRDSGIGIAAEQLSLIFQEFYQVGNPERDAGKGLGLGLAIVARLGQMLNHRIEVRSTAGRGSVFGIVLPCSAPALHPQSIDASPSAGNSDFDVDVLVSCGNDASNRSLCNLLEGWGCRVTNAVDAAVLRSALSDPPDVLICDDCGYTAATACYADSPDSRGAAPILILLGNPPGAAHPAGMAVHGHLTTPLRPARLRALLQHLLRASKNPESDDHPKTGD